MRNFTILLGWFVGTIALQGQPYDTQAFRSGLRGNPKQVTTTEHLFFTSNPTSENGQESYTVISTYNQQGICTGQKMFSIGGALIGTAEYKFDRNGNVHEIDETGWTRYKSSVPPIYCEKQKKLYTTLPEKTRLPFLETVAAKSPRATSIRMSATACCRHIPLSTETEY